jgi:hypothetical protein
MYTHIYLDKKSPKTLLCSVDLEVVPGGTYVIDGIPYKLVGRPTFFINYQDRADSHKLQSVELIVEKFPEPSLLSRLLDFNDLR